MSTPGSYTHEDIVSSRKSYSQTIYESNEKNDNYRWYVCVEKSPLRWDCIRTNYKSAMAPPSDTSSTVAVPINKWVPFVLDPFILHKTLHPKIRLFM